MPKANMNRQLTTEEKEQIVKLYNDGMLPTDIGKELRIYYKVVISTLHENGLHFYKSRMPKDMESVVLNDYLINGISPTDISDMYLIKRNAVIHVINKNNAYIGNPTYFTKDDEEYIIQHYPTDSWDDLLKHFPNKSKQALASFASRLKVKREVGLVDKWSDSELELLKEVWDTGLSKQELESLFGRTYGAIFTKAYRLNLTKSRLWTQDEDNIIKQNYNNLSPGEIANLLYRRSEYSVKVRARKLGLYSDKCKPWTDEEDHFLFENWKILPDIAIGDHIGRSRQGVKERRHYFKLYRQDPNKKSYPTLSKYIRGQIWEWKSKSMENCNWQCVITGSKDFEIHHLYSVSNILSDIMSKYNILEKQIKEYTQDELNNITQLFIEEQSKHPLGVCVRKDIHALFHKLYGKYYNTPEQWYQFQKDFCEGIYDDLLENKIA